MLDAGYQQVGRDFPVFLHPQTHTKNTRWRVLSANPPRHTGFNLLVPRRRYPEADLQRRDSDH